MQIRTELNDGLVQQSSGLVLPRRFTAREELKHESTGEELDLEMEIAVDGRGRATLRRFSVSGPALTGRAIKSLPVRTLVQDATAAAARTFGLPAGESGGRRTITHSEALLTIDSPEPRQGRAVGDERLRKVAELYRQRVSQGSRSPDQDIADLYGVHRTTAAKWVGRARAAGHLGPARPGAAGEV